MGVTWETFWSLTHADLNSIANGYKAKKKEEDYDNWLNGYYIRSAVACTMNEKNKYYKKPILDMIEEEQSEEERKKKAELFFAQLKVMQTNFELNKKKNNGGTD
jgi:hypothetical protein|nr:MAG TPA: hypothetical protein [Bacteriophage sp.]